MTTISKKQKLVNSLRSKNFTECLTSSFFFLFMIDDMIDSAKFVRASWISKIHVNTKDLPSRFRTSQTIKLSNLGSFILLFLVVENGGVIYRVLRPI